MEKQNQEFEFSECYSCGYIGWCNICVELRQHELYVDNGFFNQLDACYVPVSFCEKCEDNKADKYHEKHWYNFDAKAEVEKVKALIKNVRW